MEAPNLLRRWLRPGIGNPDPGRWLFPPSPESRWSSGVGKLGGNPRGDDHFSEEGRQELDLTDQDEIADA